MDLRRRISSPAPVETVVGLRRQQPTTGRIMALLGSAHPGPTLAVTAFATILAVALGRGLAGTTLVAAAVLAGQLSIGWSNDAIDARRDLRTGRRDKPVAAQAIETNAVASAAVIALAVCIPLSLAGGVLAGSVHLVGTAAGWAYNLGLKRSLLSPLAYALGFGSLLPFITLGLPGQPWPAWWAVLVAAALGVAAHLVNAMPDIEDDVATGVRGFPQRIGRTACRILTPLLLLLAVAVLLVAPARITLVSLLLAGAAGISAITGTALPASPTSRRPFHAAILTSGLVVVLFLSQGSDIV